ncbi:molybdopterin-binding protein [Sulfodiicoccus acidiphilus]|uniref:Molybdopterin-binding protein n=1 Tax=Sulfodiicoccus acidiphilus TaxID=1670455 RepID=A0A348B2Z2_9CREN|nr:sulfite oxidase-like oxidoreductase [Sulfodiicoccus acidiphilus]BBD72544.1 molybdopterin-binding protein [Sulfodiicoccus acidiphilus]GGT93781.1 molybdopterin-binding protein [Sulfodiicoccus acidiphilus]
MSNTSKGIEERVPPGQVVTNKFPVLSLGPTPKVERSRLRLRVFGSVGRVMELSWDELMKFPKVEKILDFHCVTGWSRLGDLWEGISLRSLLEAAGPKGEYIMLHSYDGYTTNVPLRYAIDDNSMLAYKLNGKELEPDHGGPLRALIPQLYAWKSAKWISAIEVMVEDSPGFWEQRGYHMLGDYWKEQRYAESYDFMSIINIRKRRSK